jgi:hypothetical protein
MLLFFLGLFTYLGFNWEDVGDPAVLPIILISLRD